MCKTLYSQYVYSGPSSLSLYPVVFPAHEMSLISLAAPFSPQIPEDFHAPAGALLYLQVTFVIHFHRKLQAYPKNSDSISEDSSCASSASICTSRSS